jgi:hypothetical protein
MMRRLAIVVAVTLGLGCSAAFAATMSVGSWHLWAGSQTLTKSQCTVTGATDTYSDELHQTANNSAAATLAELPDANKRQWIYLQFDLTACNIPTSGGADSATLTLFESTAPKNASRTLTLAWNLDGELRNRDDEQCRHRDHRDRRRRFVHQEPLDQLRLADQRRRRAGHGRSGDLQLERGRSQQAAARGQL